ncbi:MAG: hypothetical protein O3A92_04470 [Verrucomicrobia bacterium]|nr:hypothetical protein [Verrucomicrobiota bacterium]
MRLLLLAAISMLLVSCHADLEERTRLRGTTEAAVVAELGTPSYSNVMTLKPTVPQTHFPA